LGQALYGLASRVLALVSVIADSQRQEPNQTGGTEKLNLLLRSPADYIFIRRIPISGIVLAWKLDGK
jgi:hypothetical protein